MTITRRPRTHTVPPTIKAYAPPQPNITLHRPQTFGDWVAGLFFVNFTHFCIFPHEVKVHDELNTDADFEVLCAFVGKTSRVGLYGRFPGGAIMHSRFAQAPHPEAALQLARYLAAARGCNIIVRIK